MSNLLSEVHPELVLEWSERNNRKNDTGQDYIRIKQNSLVDRNLRSRMADQRKGSFKR